MNLARCPIFVLCALVLTACQQYAPSRLDLDAHHLELAARDPFTPEVAAYAERVSTPSTRPSSFDAGDGLSALVSTPP